jgi:hypothetical protein
MPLFRPVGRGRRVHRDRRSLARAARPKAIGLSAQSSADNGASVDFGDPAAGVWHAAVLHVGDGAEQAPRQLPGVPAIDDNRGDPSGSRGDLKLAVTVELVAMRAA